MKSLINKIIITTIISLPTVVSASSTVEVHNNVSGWSRGVGHEATTIMESGTYANNLTGYFKSTFSPIPFLGGFAGVAIYAGGCTFAAKFDDDNHLVFKQTTSCSGSKPEIIGNGTGNITINLNPIG